MLHIISTLVLMILALGVYYRRRPAIHMTLMSSAFVLDLMLVLYIEFTRQAVESVAQRFRPLLWTHALISVTVLALYVIQLVLGRRLLAVAASNLHTITIASDHSRNLHRCLGITFLVLRMLNYLTAFLV